MDSHPRGCLCEYCQFIRRARRQPRHDVQERFHASGHGFDFDFRETDNELAHLGGLQIININENDDQNRSSPRTSHHDIIRRPCSASASESSVEIIPARPIHRQHNLSHPHSHSHSHSNSNASGRVDGYLDQGQFCDQHQNVTIRPGGAGGWFGSPTGFGYPQNQPYDRLQEHWELLQQHNRDKVIAEQREEERKHEIIRQQTIAEVERHTREIEERTQKAVADYREERRRVDDEIQAAIDRHDLETVRREQEKKAAIDAALKKKMEEDEAKRKAEAALKAKWEAEHAKEIACCYPNPVSGGCYPKLPVGYITAEALNAYHIPWRYDQDDPRYIIIERDLPPRDLEVLVKHTHGLFHCDTELLVNDEYRGYQRREHFPHGTMRRTQSEDGYNWYGPRKPRLVRKHRSGYGRIPYVLT